MCNFKISWFLAACVVDSVADPSLEWKPNTMCPINNHRWLPCCACFKYWASLHISARIEHLTQSHRLQLIFTAEIRCDQRTSTETVTVCICVFYWSVSGSVSCTELGTSLRSLMGTGVSVSGFVRLRHWPRDLSRFANAKKRNEVPVFTALFLTFIHVQDCENCV